MKTIALSMRFRVALECLEYRRLLASDFLPGDANQDYYFDEADVVQVMKFGKFNSGETAVWSEGDWNEDGRFDVSDILFAINGGALYRNGPYDNDAGSAVEQLTPIATLGDPDVTIFYLPENGTVVASATAGMTALHLVSRSDSFIGNRGPGFFDSAVVDSQFINDVAGRSWIEHPGLLPIGWSDQQVIDDLLVDGATFGGGGLGVVRLGDRRDFPSERPDNALVTEASEPPSFVETEEANVRLTYDPQSGDVLIEAIEVRMAAIELVSPEGIFTGTVGAEHRYTAGSFDEASPERFFRAAADAPEGIIRFTPGFTTIFLPGIARTGLSAEEFASGVYPGGVTDPRGPLSLTLVIGPAFAECKELLGDGVIVGDANLDGQFNSQDLVLIFQSGEYLDEIPHNSTWNDGDWTCDGDFNTSDLVAAFQSGHYDLPAAAVALRRDGENFSQSKSVDLKVPQGPESKLNNVRRQLVQTVNPSHKQLRSRGVIAQNSATDEVMANLELFT